MPNRTALPRQWCIYPMVLLAALSTTALGQAPATAPAPPGNASGEAAAQGGGSTPAPPTSGSGNGQSDPSLRSNGGEQPQKQPHGGCQFREQKLELIV